MNIIVTGGAGYIGSHVALELIESGYSVTIIDDLSTGHENLIPKNAKFIKCNINEKEKINSILKNDDYSAIFHFAGFIQVEESVNFPEKYFQNNTENSETLFKICINNNLNNIVFSSTAAIYDSKNSLKSIDETCELNPINPYGKSKLLAEQFLINNSKKINYIILRYFNVAGADPKMRSGLISKKSTHLIKVVSEALIGKRNNVTIFGDDYKTKDGTAVRDYIHVSDLAEIHLKVLEFLFEKKQSSIFNCGYGKGYSVKEVIKIASKVSKGKININIGPRRDGDVEFLVSDVSKIQDNIQWKPKYDKLEFIIKTSIDWELKIKNEKFI